MKLRIKMKKSQSIKRYRLPQNRFYGLWSSQRPLNGVRVKNDYSKQFFFLNREPYPLSWTSGWRSIMKLPIIAVIMAITRQTSWKAKYSGEELENGTNLADSTQDFRNIDFSSFFETLSLFYGSFKNI